MSVFKAYDIRGKYPGEIDEPFARRVGRAAAAFLGARRAVIGMDVRTCAPAVARACAEGAAEVCGEVALLGVSTTPMLYFASASGGYDLGIMVTASHNPPEYIGFKICREGAKPVGEATGLKEIEKLAVERPAGPGRAEIGRVDVVEEYGAHLRKSAVLARPLRIAVDTANGAVGPFFDRLTRGLPMEVARLCFEPDGRFPNHEPDPLKDRNVQDLKKQIAASPVDLGAAFDGDGDRVILLDEVGERIPGDLVTCLLALDALRREPGAAIVYDLRSSWVVREEIERAGGRAIRERVGHAFIKETMRRHSAALGGELSGHYYFKDHFFADSGMMAFLRFAGIVSRDRRPLSEIVSGLRRYAKSSEINFHVRDKAAAMESAASAFPGVRVERLDGVTVETDAFWFNLRPSNTEPLIRLNAEARTAALLEEVRSKLTGLLGPPE
jgi:phosphomannomutase